jgi:hypothetical protein
MKIKRTLIFSLFVFSILAMWYFVRKPAPPIVEIEQPETQVPRRVVKPPVAIKPPDTKMAPALPKIGNRTYYGQLPSGVSDLKDLKLYNSQSKDWRKKLETHIVKLGGENLKDYKIIPEESYIIPESDGGRMVERVVVKINGKDGQYTSFFAEVDSETGYVMKTWGVAIQEKRPHRH